jgi:hypothetical protein
MQLPQQRLWPHCLSHGPTRATKRESFARQPCLLEHEGSIMNPSIPRALRCAGCARTARCTVSVCGSRNGGALPEVKLRRVSRQYPMSGSCFKIMKPFSYFPLIVCHLIRGRGTRLRNQLVRISKWLSLEGELGLGFIGPQQITCAARGQSCRRQPGRVTTMWLSFRVRCLKHRLIAVKH